MTSMLMIHKISLSDKDFRTISDLVYHNCGINLHEGKRELIRARLAKLIRKGNFGTFSDYLHHLENDTNGNELLKLIDAISTNLTSFFREYQHFDYLQKEFLPHLVQKKQKDGNLRIRAWSAGCSSGEEPYSIAITLLENIPNPFVWDIKILASDISRSMMTLAHTGIYPKEKVAPVSPLQKHKFFMPRRIRGHKSYEVSPALRDIVMLRRLNLIKEWPMKGPLDFIFCRNVMIYFDKSTRQELIDRFWNILDSGAILFAGHSESLTGITHKFKYIRPTIYMKALGIEMKKKTFIVGISDAYISNDPADLLVTYSLGSCIGLCLYDPFAHVGGLLHCQLPSSKLDVNRSKQKPYMFVDTGLETLINRMGKLGAVCKRMRVKIAGAATMDISPKGFDIGKRNFLAARKHLWQNFMMIDSKDIGGTEPRNMYFDVADGVVVIKSKGKVRKL